MVCLVCGEVLCASMRVFVGESLGVSNIRLSSIRVPFFLYPVCTKAMPYGSHWRIWGITEAIFTLVPVWRKVIGKLQVINAGSCIVLTNSSVGNKPRVLPSKTQYAGNWQVQAGWEDNLTK